jgi:hypothetical protein
MKCKVFEHTFQHTIHTILALAAIEDFELRSVDISHAFTNSVTTLMLRYI